MDPDAWSIQERITDQDGTFDTRIVTARKCAYWLPESIREITKGDGELVALGRAKQKLKDQAEKVCSYRGSERSPLSDSSENRYFIEKVKCGITDIVLSLGSLSGTIVAAVRFRKGGESKWLYLSESEGFPEFTLTDRDIYKDLIEGNTDEEFITYLSEHRAYDLDGVSFGDDYEDLFRSIHANPGSPAVSYSRYTSAVDCNVWVGSQLTAANR